MNSFIRRILRPGLRITRTQALKIAREECQKQGWGFEDPVMVSEKRHVFIIHPSSNMRPGGPWIWINVHTGEVISAVQPPR